MQMGIGLGVLFVVYLVSKWAELETLLFLLNALPIILIVVVVFQNDIRRGLMRVGARAFFAGMSRQQESRVIDEVVAAATELARHRIGALIAFEQDANLDEFVVGQGTTIDAAVQRELLVSLFVPETLNKLHDGAVIIRNLRDRQGRRLLPDARHEGARQVAGVAPPGRPRHHRGDRRGRRRRERGARDASASASTATSSRTSTGRRSARRSSASSARARGANGKRRGRSARARWRRPGLGATALPRRPAPSPAAGRPSRRRRRSGRRSISGSLIITGSTLLAPPVPRGESSVRSERESVKPSAKPAARPMTAAKPIETPKPVSAPPNPPRPTED